MQRLAYTGLLSAALVLASCEALCRTGVELDIDVIIDGFDNTRWPGRLEIVSQSPLVILDGAHNLKAARCLADFMASRFSGRNITLVAGILDDKPYGQMLAALLPVCTRAVITRPRIGRALPPETLSREAKKHLDDVRVVGTVEAAVSEVIDRAQTDDVICIAGSLYVVGEAKETLAKYPHLVRP